MAFIREILNYKSLAIAGLEKNTGKTECLNYILSRLAASGKKIAVTSIGLDGETTDQVSQTDKPEIKLYEGMVYVTAEKCYRQKRPHSEILSVSSYGTALGKLVTAEVRHSGMALLSGPATTAALKEVIHTMPQFGVDTIIVDGALSRMSQASPVVTDCMVLATGAALSASMDEVVSKTAFTAELINLPLYTGPHADILKTADGIWYMDEAGLLHNSGKRSFLTAENDGSIFKNAPLIYTAGAVTDKLLDYVRIQESVKHFTLLVKDFTRLFVSKNALHAFTARGGKVEVLHRSRLLAVCINPFSPQGYHMNPAKLLGRLRDKLYVPVYDILNMSETE